MQIVFSDEKNAKDISFTGDRDVCAASTDAGDVKRN